MDHFTAGLILVVLAGVLAVIFLPTRIIIAAIIVAAMMGVMAMTSDEAKGAEPIRVETARPVPVFVCTDPESDR